MAPNKAGFNLKLQLAGPQWRLFSRRRQDPRFKKYAHRIWARDGYQCQACGYSARNGLEVLNLDGNYARSKPENMITTCLFCAQSHFLDAVGHGLPGNGILIYCPSLTQSEINAISHVIAHGLVLGGKYAADAKTQYRSLRLRSQLVEKTLGEGMSDPSRYVRLMIDIVSDSLEAFDQAFQQNIRLLPDVLAFSAVTQERVLEAFHELQFSSEVLSS